MAFISTLIWTIKQGGNMKYNPVTALKSLKRDKLTSTQYSAIGPAQKHPPQPNINTRRLPKSPRLAI